MKRAILVCVILLLSTSAHTECPTADLTGDCYVGLADLAVLANEWAGQTSMPLLYDMASQWMTVGHGPQGMFFVSINDPGVPDHEVFNGYMSKYETTNAQYCEYLNAALGDGLITVYNNRVYAASDTSYLQTYFDTYDADPDSQIIYSGGVFSVRSRDGYSMADHPVVEVSWYGATAFCEYFGYRLPTEWEWQAVADYDDSYTYGCGTSIDQSKANYYDNEHANPLGLSSYPYTTPVGHYSAYGYGICDMAGNVWEWTSSLYAPPDGNRVICGGSWFHSDFGCSVSYRTYGSPGGASNSIGFRVCR